MPHESPASKEKVRETFGISFGTKRKDGVMRPLGEAVEVAESLRLPSIQFDFRYRTIEELNENKKLMLDYRERNRGAHISIHCDNPQVDPSTLEIFNIDKLLLEAQLLRELNGESCTIHPPAISHAVFDRQPKDVQDKILEQYISAISRIAILGAGDERPFVLSIENMPNKKDDAESLETEEGGGNWGQSVDEILTLVDGVKRKIDESVAERCVGVTLDVNHALHGVEISDYEKVLENWFERLGGNIRVIHLTAPKEENAKFSEKCRLVFNLSALYSPDARVFMETKRGADVTKDLFEFASLADK